MTRAHGMSRKAPCRGSSHGPGLFVNITEYLTWPTLIPFFEGIVEHLGIPCSVEMKVSRLEDNGDCDYLARFLMKKPV